MAAATGPTHCGVRRSERFAWQNGLLMLALVLAIFSLCLGEVFVAPRDRVANRSGAQCVWASLETIGRHFGIAPLYDLTAHYRGTSDPGEVSRVLGSRGVKYYGRSEGPQDYQGLQSALANDWPVAVGLGGIHMLLLVDMDASSVKVIDNSDPRLGVQQWPLQRFRQRWDGWYVTIPPPPGAWHNALWTPVP